MDEEKKIIYLEINSTKAVEGSAAATAALAKMERATESMDSTMSRMEKGLASVALMLKAHLALAIADLAARLGQMAKDSLSAVGGLDELAEQAGITTRGFQALQFSAAQNGVKLEELQAGISKFSVKMGEAAAGNKDMVEALNTLGVKILDVNGKLRPTEDAMQDVAAANLKIEDPAKRTAASVDIFSKTGTKFLPVLKDIAAGFDSMGSAATKNGAMLDEHVTKRLDQLGDSAERNKLKLRAMFAEAAVAALDFIDAQMKAAAGPPPKGAAWEEDLPKKIRAASDAMMVEAAGLAAGVAQAFAGAAQQIPKFFIDAFNEVLKAAEGMVNTLSKGAGSWFGGGIPSVSFGQIPGGGASATGYVQGVANAAAAARTDMQAYQARQDSRFGQASNGTQWGVVNDGLPAKSGPAAGVSNPGIKGAGQAEADRINKLMRDTGRDLAAARQEADASERGARAVADLEIHYKALKAAQDAYGTTADKNTGQVAALTAKIEEQMKATERAKNLKDFNLGTEDLERANVLLAAENTLINASVEVRARELAIIKTKQEVQAKGLDENDPREKAAIDRRGEAIAQNERLKAQGEELKKSNELWTAPLKSALESIQKTAADAFEGMLESGKFSFQALGDVVKKTVIRMIAEFAALAVIRPIMGSMMGGLQSIGLVSGSTASSLGFGSTGGVGGSGVGMPSFGGSGMGFFSQPIVNSFGRNIDSEIANWSTYGTSAQNSLNGGFLGGTTWGQGLGAAAGIGMGAYQLATAKGNTAKTIGGIGSMVGAGMSLIPGMQIPGMAISMLSAILPSLFGGEEYKWDPLAGANVQFNPGAGGYSMAESQQLGGKAIGGQFAGVGSTLDAFFKRAGGLTNPGNAFGASVWNNQREGTTSTYEIHPTDGSTQLTRDQSGDPSKAIDAMIAKVFYNSIQNNAAMNASPTLRTAFNNREPTSVAQIQSLLDLVDAYDKLGKVTPTAEAALKQINAQFADLTAGANEWGLSLAPIQAEQKKVTTRYAQDFIDGMLDPLAVQMRALDDQRKDAVKSAEYIRDNVKDVYVDIARITEYYTKKELDLKEQAMAASVDSLQALVRRLSYGDLAAASPDTTLAGTRGTYEAALAQARGGSTTARNNLAGFAESYAGSVRTNFASTAEGAALIDQIRRDILEVIGSTIGGGGSSGSAANGNSSFNPLLQTVNEQSGQIAALIEEMRQTREQLAAATAQLQRRA